MRTLQVVVESDGRMRPLEPFVAPVGTVALVLVQDEAEETCGALLAESALADWERHEEDEAWASLQPER